MPSPIRIAFAGTPEFAAVSLRALLARPEFEVVAVYTQPDRPAGRGRQLAASPVKLVALEHGLTLRQPSTLRDEAEQAQLRTLQLDVMVVVAYGLILPEAVLAAPRRGCVNLHASLLPRWRGAAPIEHAILAGDSETGVSLMVVEPALDSGPVLATASCPITDADTSGDLHARLADLGARLLCANLGAWVRGELPAIVQDHARATYAPKISKAETTLDWSAPATTLLRQIHAFNPRWGASTELAGEPVKIWDAEEGQNVSSHLPGDVVSAEGGVLEIATGRGTLRLLRLQTPGKKPVSAADYINARLSWAAGSGTLKAIVNDHRRHGAASRAAAARAVQAVTVSGASLPTAIERALRDTAGADPSLCRELAYGALRFRPQLEAVLGRLLNRPLAANAQDVHALLLIGLYQLQHLRTPPHVAVSTTVEAARILNKSWACTLINAVLRNSQRKFISSEAQPEAGDVERYAHPQWLIDAIRSEYPDCWQPILNANNGRPPLTLRVNRLCSTRDAYLKVLQEQGIPAVATRYAPSGIRLESAVAVEALPGFASGVVSVQDEAAQLAAPLLDVAPGMRVLDACAAPGGKSAHLLETEPALAELVAIDSDPLRIERLQSTLRRLALSATVLCADAAEPATWWDGKPFDRILLDAPCSATGVIRRHPDIKSLRAPSDIAQFARIQATLLRTLWPLLRTGGKLLYVTCSVMKAENAQVVEDFVSEQADARVLPINEQWGLPMGAGRQSLPFEENMDGFFYALLGRQ